MDKGERTDAVFLAGVGRATIFRPDKGLKIAGRPMARLGGKNSTITSDQRVEGAGSP